MKLAITEINLTCIDRDFAIKLRNEIHAAAKDDIFMPVEKQQFPALNKLKELIDGAFISHIAGVHFNRRSES
jgi:hypothetical protein